MFVGEGDVDEFERSGPGRFAVIRLHLGLEAGGRRDEEGVMARVLSCCGDALEDLHIEGGSLDVQSLMREGMRGECGGLLPGFAELTV